MVNRTAPLQDPQLTSFDSSVNHFELSRSSVPIKGRYLIDTSKATPVFPQRPTSLSHFSKKVAAVKGDATGRSINAYFGTYGGIDLDFSVKGGGTALIAVEATFGSYSSVQVHISAIAADTRLALHVSTNGPIFLTLPSDFTGTVLGGANIHFSPQLKATTMAVNEDRAYSCSFVGAFRGQDGTAWEGHCIDLGTTRGRIQVGMLCAMAAFFAVVFSVLGYKV
ncbi:hypothetical protein MNV49_003590 [Pseudohyphozyma bogoriensis]|nr:hypothetical protein MNV49_003590 [Pseudohyphozyma bogoriensis]